jgi:alpha-L-rhamnosidase
VRAVYRSPRGAIVSGWRRGRDGSIVVTVTIPANTSGRVFLPAEREPAAVGRGAHFEGLHDGRAVFRVGAGSYRFLVKRSSARW